ncbi:hypothetical protein V8G54_013129 [Vigna mungo]|uniref:PORR domain-containing protein n=1 Tax=Vigna mungo TaxID=3915 RepID=A0AAQ3NW93_VIGMU
MEVDFPIVTICRKKGDIEYFLKSGLLPIERLCSQGRLCSQTHAVNLTNWSDLSDQSGGEGSRSCWIIKGGLPNLLRRGLPNQEGIKNMEGRNNTLERRTGGQKMSMAESKMNMAEYRRNMQEIREMLQEIKIHIKGLGRSEESVMTGQKEGSDEEEMEEDRGEQNWRQRVELARFEGLDPLGWISQAEKFFDTQNVKEKERRRLAYSCMEGGTIYWFRAWKNKTKNLSWKGLKEALIMGFGGRDRGETEATAVLSIDGFARIRGQDRREENICGEEGNAANGDEDMDVTAANCDGDMSVTATGKVEKAVDFTVADKVEKAVIFTVAEKVAVFSGDSVVGCGMNVKTVKAGKKRSGGREYASNWEQKGEDATDNNGARKGKETPIFSWVKREELITYEGIDKQDQTTGATNDFKVQSTKGSTKAHPNNKENVVQGCKTWHKKFKHLSWKNLAPTLIKIVEGNKRSSLCENWAAVTQRGSVEILYESLQVDGATAKSVVATRADEVRVEILRTSQNWAKRIQEEWKLLEEDLPSPKPPDLNWRAASSGIYVRIYDDKIEGLRRDIEYFFKLGLLPVERLCSQGRLCSQTHAVYSDYPFFNNNPVLSFIFDCSVCAIGRVLEMKAVKRVKKLLMMFVNDTLRLQALRMIRRELGLHEDFRDSILGKFNGDFKLVGLEVVELVARDEKLELSEVEKWRDQFETKFVFPVGFPTGFKIEKGFTERLKNWQRLSYTEPYERKEVVRVRTCKGMERYEKRLLSLTVEKMVEDDQLVHFRRDLGIEVNVCELLLRHPGRDSNVVVCKVIEEGESQGESQGDWVIPFLENCEESISP